jgi:hypothetical protein
MLTENLPKIPQFFCEICKTNSGNKKDYNKHLLTAKHKKNDFLTKTGISLTENPLVEENHDHECSYCNKVYKSRVGLWYHKKKCNYETCIVIKEEENIKIVDVMAEQNQLLMEQNKHLIDQHQDLKLLIIDICKNMKDTNNNISNIHYSNNHNNSHNKTFNLQVFLNETCKDAMNLTDFVDSLQIQLSDLEKVGKDGFVAGISNIILKNLKALDVTMRPVHCSDQKRETMYIKDQNEWHNDSKELPENQKLKKAIKQIAHKNICKIPEWKKLYPDCIYAESRKSDLYNHIMYEAMDHNEANSEKIIKKIAKEVGITK